MGITRRELYAERPEKPTKLTTIDTAVLRVTIFEPLALDYSGPDS